MTNTQQTAWPVQVQLPRQAAAPDGPVDMVFMYLFHYAFRRDLRLFAEAVPPTPVEDRRAWQRLADRWAVFAAQLEHHHTAEDLVLWPYLRERVAPEDLVVLEAMEAEHDAIEPVLERIAPAFAALRQRPDAVAHGTLVRAIADSEAILDQHLAHEETAAIAIMQRVMSDQEWQDVEKQLGAGQPASVVFTLVPWALAGLPEPDLEVVLRRLPAPMRLLHRLLAGRFARREERIFGV